jgi:endonuclease-3 related protein
MPWSTAQAGLPAGKLLSRYYFALQGSFGPQHWWPARTRLEVILGAILTQNTAWHNATLALRNLRQSGLLSWQGLRRAALPCLEACVRPAGFYRQKARTIRNLVDWLSLRHAGSLHRLFSQPPEELRRQLLDLRGLGPETVDAILLYAAQFPLFVADAYTRRVLARHGLVPIAADYHQTQEFLHAHLPRHALLFNEFHALLVEVGKKHCRPHYPRCAGCPLEEFLPGGGAAQNRVQAQEPAATSWQELQPA